MIRWPNIGILPTRYVEGVKSAGGEAERLDMLPLDELLSKNHTTDAHVVCYGIFHKQSATYAKSQELMRLNKSSVGHLDGLGFEVHTLCFMVDLDLPKHVLWTEEEMEEFAGLYTAARTREPLVSAWHASYTTRSGARLVYVLDKPVLAEAGEAIYRGLIHRLEQTELAPYLDASTNDWTRLFRLPKVIRDGVSTEEAPFFDLTTNEEQPLLDVSQIAPIFGMAKKHGTIVPLVAEQPDPDKAKALLYGISDATGKEVLTEWFKIARRRLKGRQSLDVIQGTYNIEDASEGRNNTLRGMVGQVVSLLFRVAGTTPRHVYALFVDPCEQLEARTGDDDGKGWLEILWHLVKHCWEKEAAEFQEEQKEAAKSEAVIEKVSSSVLRGAVKWCDDPNLLQAEEKAMEWLSGYLIAFADEAYYVMRPDGFYDRVGVKAQNLAARVRELGMAGVIKLTEEAVVNGELVVRELPIQKVINRHATITSKSVGVIGRDGSTIKNLGTEVSSFEFKMYALRKDITPQWSDEVDAWMQAAFGEHCTMVKHWIGHALDFEGGGICALSLNAPPGIGKKMLVEGLAECVDTQTVADAKELTGRFQSEMLSTPFLVINEGMPRVGRDTQVDPADAFRALIAGDTTHVERKGKGMISIHNPMRILITANNDDVLHGLYRHRDLSQHDREALGRRILHFDLDDQGQEWLRKRGGKSYTGNPEKRWIRGDDGGQSNWVVARHFLALHKHRLPSPAGNRLLVEGDPESEIVRDMAISSGGSPEIIETVIRMLEETNPPSGIIIKGPYLWVTSVGVRDFQKALNPHTKPFSLAAVGKVLKSLSREKNSTPRQVPGKSVKVRAWSVDTRMLWRHANQHGFTCSKLHAMIESLP